MGWTCFLITKVLVYIACFIPASSQLFHYYSTDEGVVRRLYVFLTYIGGLGFIALTLDQLRQLINFNRNVELAKRDAPDFRAYQMFMQKPLEFRLCGVVIEPRLFKFLSTSSVTYIVKTIFSLVLIESYGPLDAQQSVAS